MSFLRALKIYLARYHYSSVIENYDSKAPLFNPNNENELNNNGYRKYQNINNKYISFLNDFFYIKKNYFVDSKIIAEIFNKIFKEIIGDIKLYLGNDARLEYINVQHTSTDDTRTVSNSWHTDSVGLRLKCYICLGAVGEQPTIIKKNQYKKIYKPSFSEEMRFSGHQNIQKKNNQILLNHKTGSIIMFDTNYLHRGAYEIKNSKRTVIVLEFMNYKKSEALLKKSLISVPVGRQNSKFKFGKNFLNNFNYSNYIREYLKV